MLTAARPPKRCQQQPHALVKSAERHTGSAPASATTTQPHPGLRAWTRPDTVAVPCERGSSLADVDSARQVEQM